MPAQKLVPSSVQSRVQHLRNVVDWRDGLSCKFAGTVCSLKNEMRGDRRHSSLKTNNRNHSSTSESDKDRTATY